MPSSSISLASKYTIHPILASIFAIGLGLVSSSARPAPCIQSIHPSSSLYRPLLLPGIHASNPSSASHRSSLSVISTSPACHHAFIFFPSVAERGVCGGSRWTLSARISYLLTAYSSSTCPAFNPIQSSPVHPSQLSSLSPSSLFAIGLLYQHRLFIAFSMDPLCLGHVSRGFVAFNLPAPHYDRRRSGTAA